MSPVALFCFKRLDTLSKCIESLKACPEAKETDLVIFSDAGRDFEEQKKVDEIRIFLQNIVGFKSIQINNRMENLGVDYNIIQGIQEMAGRFENFIVLEDDLVVSNQFLWFLNAGLCHFKDFDKVLTLSAFNYVNIPKTYIWDCYFAKRTNPWGWATWSHKIKVVDWDLAEKENFLTNSQELNGFNIWGSDRTRMLRRTLIGEIRAWDIRLDYYQYKMNYSTAYSSKNLIVNNGFNDPINASNTIGFNRFKTNIDIYKVNNLKLPDFLPFNKLIEKRYIERNNLFHRIKTVIFKKLKIYNH
jgi:hypothetical protein